MNGVSTQMDCDLLRNISVELSEEISSVLGEQGILHVFIEKVAGLHSQWLGYGPLALCELLLNQR